MLLYEAFREGRENPLQPLPVQYADFALWQRRRLNEEALGSGIGYWKEHLAEIPERLELPADRARPAMQTFGADACLVALSGEQTAALKRLSQKNQATLYMTMLAAFGLLLSRYSGQDDIVVGSPIANRQEEQLEGLIGFFVNSLVMRIRVNAETSFRELLAQVRRTALDAYLYQDVPFERLVEELSPQRSLNAPPLFQVVFALQNAPVEAQRFRGLETETVGRENLRVRFDLELHAWESGERITLYWLYNRDLFDRWRIEQMARHYTQLLESLGEGPDEAMHRLPMLSAGEREKLLAGCSGEVRAVPEATLPELFEAQAARTPDAVAVVYEEEELSYGELNERANRLAHTLIDAGVGPESIVGIALERSPEMVIALLATLKAGEPTFLWIRIIRLSG